MLSPRQIESRIDCNPVVFGGKPIVRGTRIAVSLISDWVDAGVPVTQILDDYPNLSRGDIEAAVAYASQERTQVDVRTF